MVFAWSQGLTWFRHGRCRKLFDFPRVLGRLLCASTRIGNATIPQDVLIYVNLDRISSVVSCQRRHSHEHRFLYFPSSPTRTRSRGVSSPVASFNPFMAVVMTEVDGVHGTVRNEQQYQQSLQSYDSRSLSISCLTHGEVIGLAVSI